MYYKVKKTRINYIHYVLKKKNRKKIYFLLIINSTLINVKNKINKQRPNNELVQKIVFNKLKLYSINLKSLNLKV